MKLSIAHAALAALSTIPCIEAGPLAGDGPGRGALALALAARAAANGTAVFVAGTESGNDGDTDWTDDTCAMEINNAGGWSGTIGPWAGTCDEIAAIDGVWEVPHDEEAATITIDPEEKTLLFSGPAGSYSCDLTGIAAGEGCRDNWVPHKEKRDRPPPGGCNVDRYTVKRKGAVDPQKWFKHRKLSTNAVCRRGHGAGAGCSVGRTNSKSYAEGYTATFTPFSWISAGYSVTKTVDTGNTHTCTAKPGHVACIWKVTPYIAYNVIDIYREVCSGPFGPTSHKTRHRPNRIRSPYSSGGPYVCRYDHACLHKPSYYFWTKHFNPL